MATAGVTVARPGDPLCPEHGSGCSGFVLDSVDDIGREWCKNCTAYREEHLEEARDPEVRAAALKREITHGYPDNAAALLEHWKTSDILAATD